MDEVTKDYAVNIMRFQSGLPKHCGGNAPFRRLTTTTRGAGGRGEAEPVTE